MTWAALLDAFRSTAASVVLAVAPLAVLFTVFQLLFLRLPRPEISKVVVGTLLASVGLLVLLLGINIGFLPFGAAVGEAVAARSDKAVLIVVGAVLGFVTTWGEPAVRILAHQVEQASTGSIRSTLVLNAVCIGVAAAVAGAMARIVYGLPLEYFVLPGYGLVLVIMWFADREFVAIAIDSGGVATGPLANTFLLALALGAAAAIGGRAPLVEGLGLVALIALAPVISVISLGLLIRLKERGKESVP
jgi:hypothetical protein